MTQPEASPRTDDYLRFAVIHGDTLVFVAEDDLFAAPASGGDARRLTSGLSGIRNPAISADGTQLAFCSTAEGQPEAYLMPLTGGAVRRLTWLGDAATTVGGFTPDGQLLVVSAAGKPFRSWTQAYAVPPSGGAPRVLPFGRVSNVSYGPGGAVVLGRNTADPARWKRYRGGTAGKLWVDATGSGTFSRLLDELDTNIGSPMFVGERIYFISDHEGIGNIYSVAPDGSDMRPHTSHDTHYARFASTDGHRIAYTHAGEVWVLDPETGARPVPVRLNGPRPELSRRFFGAEKYLGVVALHPAGHSLLADVRGKLVSFGAWEENVSQHGRTQGVRYRLPAYLGDGSRIVAVSDSSGEEGLDVLDTAPGRESDVRRLADGELGRVREMVCAPGGSTVALTNHRRELLLVDIESGSVRVADTAEAGAISGPAFSPDGAYLAYSYPVSEHGSNIRLLHVADGAVHSVTDGFFADHSPAFDPDGKYLYFLSARTYKPVSDQVQFDAGFPRATKPYLVTLHAEDTSPFIGKRRPLPDPPESGKAADTEKEPVRVDVSGITSRIVAFPVSEDRYSQVVGIHGKVLTLTEPVFPAEEQDPFHKVTPPGVLSCWDLRANTGEQLSAAATDAVVSADASAMLYRKDGRLRLLAAGTKDPEDAGDEPDRKSGWIDTDRIRISVDPRAEWPQMLTEAWRLQRDRFWVPDMAGVDWKAILDRYRPLAERVSTRAEFSDLLWQFQGELGSSHAYEMGGDYRETPDWSLGQLAADIVREESAGRWAITRIPAGDGWDENAGSPLAAPGLRLAAGDTVLAVDGQPVDSDLGPAPALMHRAGQLVELVVGDRHGENPRRIVVKALSDERPVRYRAWVEENRKACHDASDGRIGYIHIPDMGSNGFAKFHRDFLTELHRDALVVDVRYNAGGNVSGLLLQKLARHRLGYDVPRWSPARSYPAEAPAGPMVCLTNEWAGSDGDIFTHGFSMCKLGRVIGMRTWGGVIGISGDVSLADGTVTTQPEFSFWFSDVGWGVENYGHDPDERCDIAPHDYVAGTDPQLARGLAVVAGELASHQPVRPDVATRPDRSWPRRPGE